MPLRSRMLHAAELSLSGLQTVVPESVAPLSWCGPASAVGDSICMATFVDAIFVAEISRGPLKHHAEEDGEERWREDVALLHPVEDRKGLREVVAVSDLTTLILM